MIDNVVRNYYELRTQSFVQYQQGVHTIAMHATQAGAQAAFRTAIRNDFNNYCVEVLEQPSGKRVAYMNWEDPLHRNAPWPTKE